MSDPPRLLDWRQTGTVGPLQPCRICGRPALMRDPNGRPCHKTCAETHSQDQDPPGLTLLASTGEDAMPDQTAGATQTGPLTRTHHEGSGLRPRQHLLTATKEYAAEGWPVFLLGRTKRPVGNCAPCRDADPLSHDPAGCTCLTCHGFYAATVDINRITAMVDAVPGGLLAIRTGAASRLLIVDIDPRHGGAIDHTLMTPTATVATGGGGWHLYYRHPGGTIPSRPLPNHPGVDIKADGGYVVAPPSTHPTTRRPYQWVRHGVSEIPPALLVACTATTASPAPPHTAPPDLHSAGGISHPDRLLAANLAAVARASEGRRYVTLYGVSRGVARMVLAGAISDSDARAALTEAGHNAGQSDREIRTAITGGFRAEGVAA